MENKQLLHQVINHIANNETEQANATLAQYLEQKSKEILSNQTEEAS